MPNVPNDVVQKPIVLEEPFTALSDMSVEDRSAGLVDLCRLIAELHRNGARANPGIAKLQ